MPIVCPRPHMAKGRSSRRSSRRRLGRSRGRSGSRSRGRCLRPGPIVRNPYLNFLRKFRKENCGMSPTETIRAGAKAWRSLQKADKLNFVMEAFYAPKRRRRMSRAMSRPTSSSRRKNTRKAGRSRRVVKC